MAIHTTNQQQRRDTSAENNPGTVECGADHADSAERSNSEPDESPGIIRANDTGSAG